MAATGLASASAPAIVLDTNVVLDVFVFNDEAAKTLHAALLGGSLRWIATADMRAELERVLAYPQIIPRLTFYGLTAGGVLASFDQYAQVVEPAARASVRCADADDQVFIDLAVAHRCPLLSKDQAVLSMKKRLAPLGVWVGPALTSETFRPD